MQYFCPLRLGNKYHHLKHIPSSIFIFLTIPWKTSNNIKKNHEMAPTKIIKMKM
jgi:hypothetical protein